MKEQMLNKLTTLTLLTVVGTTTTLIGSQTAGQADSLTSNAINRQTVSDVTIQASQPILQKERVDQPDNTLSRSAYFNANEILKTLELPVGRENTVPNTLPTGNQAVVKPSPKPSVSPDKEQVTPAPKKPANQTSVKPKPQPNVNKAAKGQVKARKHGLASWYGPGFHGRRTASGESFNAGNLTAAHRYLPFGTRVRVTNTSNGRSVVVRINDRGPFSGGRVIDLSKGAARLIGVFQSGVAPVLLEVLGR
jgi:rare lipoprotein A